MVSCALSGVQMRPRTNSGHSLSRFSVLMESATLWKVDATEAALRAEAGLDRFP